MTYRVKQFLLFVFLLLGACSTQPYIEEKNEIGYAQGTTFQIKYLAAKTVDHRKSIDSLFRFVDKSLSTYDSTSIISAINKGDTTIAINDLFAKVLKRSLFIAKETSGDFDVTIGPLVELWGFGLSKRESVDSVAVDSIKRFIGYKNIRYRRDSLRIPYGFRLDFNSIAQGYTVDLICEFLEGKGINHYMVEVGGEVRAKGVNAKEKIWKIGVDKPQENIDKEDRFQMIVELENKALATSGNYRKFWVDEKTGLKYAHTIDPRTGYPAHNKLLGVSVIASNTMDADAYATVCMVKGVRSAIDFLNSKPDLEGYLIYTDDRGKWEVYQTDGFKNYILD